MGTNRSLKVHTAKENCISQKSAQLQVKIPKIAYLKEEVTPKPDVGPNRKILLYLREQSSLQSPRAKETSWSDLGCFIRYLFASQMLAKDLAWPLSFTQTFLLHCLFFLHLLHPFLFWSFLRLLLEGIHLDLRHLPFVGNLTGIRTFYCINNILMH